MEKKMTAFRYLAYALEIIIIYILQGTPGFLPEILGGKPVLLIPLAVTIACFESEVTSLFFALSCGILLDLGFNGNIGFYAILLTLLCFVISVIFRDYLVVNFLNSFAFTGAVILLLLLLHFLFFYVAKGYSNGGYYFVHHYISRIIYTAVFFPLFYLINKSLHRNLQDF